jgi:hypothetical protein
MLAKYFNDLEFPLVLLFIVSFIGTFLLLLKPHKQHKPKSLHDQRTDQWRKYQANQGHNIDEEYCNSYGRRALWH